MGIYIFTDLPKYKEGEEIAYAVDITETYKLEGYESTVDGDATAGFVITLNHTTGKISFDVSAVFDDTNNPEGIRPENIQAKLYTGGKDAEKSANT